MEHYQKSIFELKVVTLKTKWCWEAKKKKRAWIHKIHVWKTNKQKIRLMSVVKYSTYTTKLFLRWHFSFLGDLILFKLSKNDKYHSRTEAKYVSVCKEWRRKRILFSVCRTSRSQIFKSIIIFLLIAARCI